MPRSPRVAKPTFSRWSESDNRLIQKNRFVYDLQFVRRGELHRETRTLVEWAPETLGNLGLVRERARDLEAEPRLVLVTEYGFEKNGLRFPSRDTNEERYLIGERPFVRSKTVFVFRDYGFFTVDVETKPPSVP